MKGFVRVYVLSSGMLLLFIATSLFISVITTPSDIAPAHDPIFHFPVTLIFWVLGVIEIVISMICFFAPSSVLQIVFILFNPILFFGFLFYLFGISIHPGFKAYILPLCDVFNISGMSGEACLALMNAYFFIGGTISLFRGIKRGEPFS